METGKTIRDSGNFCHWVNCRKIASLTMSALSIGVQVDVTNGQLGALADISSFTTSRLLSGWERQGAVSKSRGKVLIHSPEALVVD